MKANNTIQAHVLQMWRLLGMLEENRRVVLYGAGSHTQWLHAMVADIDGPIISAILDDKPDDKPCYWGLRPIKPEAWSPASNDMIVISSDTVNLRIKQRCRELYGNTPCLIDLYDGFPPGPHHKPNFVTPSSPSASQPPSVKQRLQDGRIIIKDSLSSVSLLDYNQTPVNKFLGHLSGNAGAILEIGSDLDSAVIKFLATRMDGIVSGINPSDRFASTNQNKPANCFPVRADGEMLPFIDNSFDAILSIATLEHVNNVDNLLKECYRVLRPGGFFFTFFGPIWSCAVGHHIFVRMEGKEMRFWRPDRNPIPDFAHLLMSKDELRVSLREGPSDDRMIEKALDWIYDGPQINRLFLDDYKRIVHDQKFDVELFEGTKRGASPPPSAEIRRQLEEKYGPDKDFQTARLEWLLRKPLGAPHSNISSEKTTEDFFSKLRCPVSHEPLQLDQPTQRLTARHADMAYPIHDGIPVLLPQVAIQLNEDI